jgi:tetratricopeptide (TPR) repeat protein
MRRLILLVALTMAVTAGAFAAAIDDGNAGLEALNAGAYDKAISLFTRAIKSGQLAGDDKEFAYLNRGKAYLGKHAYARAVADLKMAIKISPDDNDAKDALLQAQSLQSNNAGAGRGAAAPPASRGWGLLASLAGRYFWYEPEGKDPHKSFVYYDWLTPQQILRYTIRSKDETIAVGEYRLDSATGKLIEAEALTSGVYYGTATASRDGETEYFFLNNTPLRTTATYSGGTFSQKTQRFASGDWQDISSVQIVETTEAELTSDGFLKK